MEPCCVQDDNLELQPADPKRPELRTRVCRVCHRRHFTLYADPVVIDTRPHGGA